MHVHIEQEFIKLLNQMVFDLFSPLKHKSQTTPVTKGSVSVAGLVNPFVHFVQRLNREHIATERRGPDDVLEGSIWSIMKRTTTQLQS